MDGFIIVHRKIMDSFVFQNPYYLKLWMYCMLKASYKKRSVYVGTTQVALEIGQFVWGRKEAAADLNRGLKESEKKSVSTWENLLKKMEKEEMVIRKTTNKFTIVTIVNYEFYQKNFNSKLTATSQQNESNPNSSPNIKKEAESVDIIDDSELPFGEVNSNFDDNLTSKNSGTPQNLNTNNNLTKGCSSDSYINNKYKSAYDMYQKSFSNPMTEIIAQSIAEWINDFEGNEEIVAYAIEQAGRNAAQTPKYFETILRSWEKQGIKTLDKAIQQTEEFEAKKVRKIEQRILAEEAEKRMGEPLPAQELPKVSLINWLDQEGQA